MFAWKFFCCSYASTRRRRKVSVVYILSPIDDRIFKDINQQDVNGWTPAFTAAYHGRLGCLQMLVKWGAKLDEFDNEGNTPGKKSLFKILFKKKSSCSCDNLVIFISFIKVSVSDTICCLILNFVLTMVNFHI